MSSNTPQVVVVEDEPELRELLIAFLEICGCEPKVFADGTDFFRHLNGRPAGPDLAVVDLTLPGLSGRDLINLLQARFPELPLLVISGMSERDVEALLAGCERCAYLAKPFGLDSFRDTVSGLLKAWPGYSKSPAAGAATRR
ncbi:MAG: response regulator [Puniceicoccaceae bacterium]|nr:MAG: response regulator [Puniceicoccaceae bacterium]